MTTSFPAHFARQYDSHLKHLKLKGLQPKTIDAYARAIRRLGAYFDYRIEALTEAQLTEYFSDLIGTHSWSAVKLDLYGLKFFTTHVLKKPWAMPDLIKPPKTQRLPDIVTVDEAQRLFLATRVLSYRVFYFTLYSLGLRLGEGLALTVADIDAERSLKVLVYRAPATPATPASSLAAAARACSGLCVDRPMIISCPTRRRTASTGRSSCPTCTPSASHSKAISTWSLTMKQAPASRVIRRNARQSASI